MPSAPRVMIAQAVALFTLFFASPSFAQVPLNADPWPRISDVVHTIRTAADQKAKGDASYELLKAFPLTVDQIRRAPDATIDELASLLESENELVVFHAARALGAFGTKALRAVPALRHALAEFRRSWDEYISARIPPVIILSTGVDTGDVICQALDRIGVPTDYRNCFEGEFIYDQRLHAPEPSMLRWSKFIRR